VTGIRSIAVKVVIAVIISLLMGLVIFNTMVNKLPGESVSYQADFKDVAGLRAGDDVRLAGVRVGRVNDIKLGGSGALVEFDVTKANPMLSNTSLQLRYQNLLGQRYLAMVWVFPDEQTGQVTVLPRFWLPQAADRAWRRRRWTSWTPRRWIRMRSFPSNRS